MGFILYKLIINLLLPPGIFIVLLSISIYFMYKKNIKYAYILITITTLLIYLLSITPTKDLFVLPLEDSFAVVSKQKIDKSDGIIVLGGGVYENIYISLNQIGQPSQTALARLNEAVRLYNYKNSIDQSTQIFLTGGSVYNNGNTEAEVYRKYLISLGVDSKDIILENISRTTYENIYHIRELLFEMQIKNPLLVTSATHMRRGMMTLESFGIDAIAAPCDFITSRSEYNISDFFPSAINIDQIKRALWEYIGIIYYKYKLIY